MTHHHHNHHHGGNCSHEHHEEDKETYQVANKDSLYNFIDTDKLKCFNESSRDAGRTVIKPEDEKEDLTRYVESAVGPDILFVIPFSVTCHVERIDILGGDESSAPIKMKIWKNKDDLDLDMADEAEADQEFDISHSHRILEFNVRRSKFIGCQSLVIYFPNCVHGDTTRIYYIGIRGKATQDKRGIVKCMYELVPQVKDHKVDVEEEGNRYKIETNTEGEL